MIFYSHLPLFSGSHGTETERGHNSGRVLTLACHIVSGLGLTVTQIRRVSFTPLG
jgi:hypothetical protein